MYELSFNDTQETKFISSNSNSTQNNANWIPLSDKNNQETLKLLITSLWILFCENKFWCDIECDIEEWY